MALLCIAGQGMSTYSAPELALNMASEEPGFPIQIVSLSLEGHPHIIAMVCMALSLSIMHGQYHANDWPAYCTSASLHCCSESSSIVSFKPGGSHTPQPVLSGGPPVN